MTREDIIKLAREAGLCTWEVVPDDEARKLEHFAGLIAIVVNTERDDDYASVAAAEREACAAFLETGVDMAGLASDPMLTKYTFELITVCAAAIRARAGK